MDVIKVESWVQLSGIYCIIYFSLAIAVLLEDFQFCQKKTKLKIASAIPALMRTAICQDSNIEANSSSSSYTKIQQVLVTQSTIYEILCEELSRQNRIQIAINNHQQNPSNR